MIKYKKQFGMTLIEVLIASVILFAAIGTVSGVHRILNHYQRLNMVDYALLLNQQSFFDYLSYALDQNITSGDYSIGQFHLIWSAKLQREAGVVRSFDPELDDESGYSNFGRLSLYDITYHFKQYPEKKFDVTQMAIEVGKSAGL
tara:strand:+ start:457 stop:891 length:435 start_codon:yes stop_codon:yes gene_type:complete